MIRISAPKILIFRERSSFKKTLRRENFNQRGFTLIEILIVIGLIALIMSLAAPNFGAALKINLNNTSRELATTIRTTYDEAVLKSTVYRIAFDLDKNEYWVEAGNKNYLLKTQGQLEEEERRNRKRTEEEIEALKPSFSLAKSVTRKKMSLPKGVSFTDVINSRSKEPQKKGVTYSHFFPHGFSEKLVIHLKDNYDRQSTLVVNSVTGKSKVYERYYTDEKEKK